MWVLKIKVDTEGQFVGSLAVKHKISIASYAISYYKDKKWLYLNACGFIFGSEKNKKAFVKDLKKQSRVVNYEIKNDFGIGVIKQPLYTEPFWDPKIIRLSPIIINYKEKKHTWHLASFDRKVLEKILSIAEKKLGAKLLKFKEEKITNISMTSILPELTKKQKKAFEIAINKGYYDSPRKTDLKKLAKIMNVSYATYQEHLRKAESKVVPNVYADL